MEKKAKTCPECNGTMVEGRLVDKSYCVSDAQEWSESAESIFGIGLGNRIKVISYRCLKCGYLMNYAPDEIETEIPEGKPLPKELKKPVK